MSRLRRVLEWLRRRLRRRREVEAPPRLREEAELQVLRHRDWLPEDWARYAADLAEQSYRDGYLRGLEEGAGLAPAPRPGALAGAQRERWSVWRGHPSTVEVLRRRGDPGDPLAGVPAEAAREFVAQMGRARGTYRVIPGWERGGDGGGPEQGE